MIKRAIVVMIVWVGVSLVFFLQLIMTIDEDSWLNILTFFVLINFFTDAVIVVGGAGSVCPLFWFSIPAQEHTIGCASLMPLSCTYIVFTTFKVFLQLVRGITNKVWHMGGEGGPPAPCTR